MRLEPAVGAAPPPGEISSTDAGASDLPATVCSDGELTFPLGADGSALHLVVPAYPLLRRRMGGAHDRADAK